MKREDLPVEFYFGTPIRIEWRDSARLPGWRVSHAETGIIKTIGYVVGDTEEDLAISSSLNDEDSFIDPLSIPWVSVEKVEVIDGAA